MNGETRAQLDTIGKSIRESKKREVVFSDLVHRVSLLEQSQQKLFDLCGFMLATLEVNLERKTLLCSNTKGEQDMDSLLKSWNRQWNECNVKKFD